MRNLSGYKWQTVAVNDTQVCNSWRRVVLVRPSASARTMLTDGTTELTEEKAPRKNEGDRKRKE